jgi:hypothetical protein
MAASNRTVLQFSSSQTLSGKIHPLVIFNICDCYVRRPDQAERVIGTLLGSVLPDGTVDIRNSYAVPHNESADQVFYIFHIHSFMYIPQLYFHATYQCFVVEVHSLFETKLDFKIEKLTFKILVITYKKQQMTEAKLCRLLRFWKKLHCGA